MTVTFILAKLVVPFQMSARLHTASYFFFLFVVIPFVCANLLITMTPLLHDIRPFIVVSGSMEPVIPTGSIIYTKMKQSYRVGDVITFMQGQTIISHRIDKLMTLGNQVYYSTKGDANTIGDFELVPATNVLGAVTNTIPYIGNIFILYKTPSGIILGTVLPILLYLFYVTFKPAT